MSLSLTSPLTTFATVSKSLETTIITTEKVAVEEKAAASTTTRVIAKATSKNALSSKTEAVA
jgi:hypothetical protein